MTILELELANYKMTNCEKFEVFEKAEAIKNYYDCKKIKIDLNYSLNEFIIITDDNRPIYIEVLNPYVAVGEEKTRLLQQGWTLDKIKKEFRLGSSNSIYKKLGESSYYYKVV